MNDQPSGPTIRLKLTLLYGGLFLVAGLILISITYALVRRELGPIPRGPSAVVSNADRLDNDDDEVDRDDRENRARREVRSLALRQLWRQSLVALVITSAGAFGLGWLVAGRVLDPIREITEHAQRASVATLDERIGLAGPPDELKELADTFDSMLDRLQAAFDSQRGFSAQASHELRTPLAVIRAEAEVASTQADLPAQQRSALDAILIAVSRSEQLVDGLLALSRSESTMLEHAVIDLASLVGDVVGEYLAVADDAGVRVDLHLETAYVSGDAAMLSRLIGNLAQNGLRYNVPGGRLDVAVRSDGGSAVLIVSNTGPTVHQDEIDSLFRPFARGAWAQQNRGGHGLGLAIVQSVAKAHRGTVSAQPGTQGGLVITVTLPRV